MSLSRALVAGAAAVVGAVALAGCGGSGTLSADEFRSQADAICADSNAQLAKVDDPASAAAFPSYLRALLPLQQSQLTKLEALKPPKELQDTYAEALDLLKQQGAALSAASDRMESGEDPEAVVTDVSDDVQAIQTQADAKAKALGLTVCGTERTEAPGATSTAGGATTAPATTAPATTSTPATTSSGSGTTVTPAAYVADVQVATTALQSFGELLQNSTSIEELGSNSAAAQGKLDQFDTAIAKLGTYRLAAAQLDKQRAGLVATGPAVSDVLRRFVTAAAAGDISTLQQLVPEVTQAIGKFQSAATNVG